MAQISKKAEEKAKKTYRLGQRIISLILAFVIAAAVCFTGVIYIIEKGPSESIRDRFVKEMTINEETRFASRMFVKPELLEQILGETYYSQLYVEKTVKASFKGMIAVCRYIVEKSFK